MAAIQMSADQLEQLVTSIMGAAGGSAQPQISAHAVGKVTKGEMATDNSKWVHMKVGGRRMNLFTDTGSGYTIIPPDTYCPSMGKIQAADTILRSWGSKTPLDVKGMFETETRRGARRKTKVFVLQGFRPDPLKFSGPK